MHFTYLTFMQRQTVKYIIFVMNIKTVDFDSIQYTQCLIWVHKICNSLAGSLEKAHSSFYLQ